MNRVDLIVVGAGIFGLTIAERAANQLNKNVLVIDKRGHIGGNSYSEVDEYTGIECHKYGAHIFHTSNEEVWAYVNRFADFTNYQHRVYTVHAGEVFPLPINLGTINQFFKSQYSPDEARQLIARQAAEIVGTPNNLQEQGIKLIGRPLFEAFIMNYTAKQWQVPADELSSDIITRLPVRYDYNNRYFSDTYEGIPVDGYSALFEAMLESADDRITTELGMDYFESREIQKMTNSGVPTVFTGPIDQYFDYKFGALNWRSVYFEREIVNTSDYQGCPVMNYADLDQTYTRIIEFKHFHPERSSRCYAAGAKQTIIFKEYSQKWSKGQEPYYPVNTIEDRDKLQKYRELAKTRKNIIFGGRLGEYAYYDMDATFASALRVFSSKIIPLLANYD